MKPIKNGVITFPYGVKYADRRKGVHKGVDYRATVGTPVYATVAGRVVHAGPHSYGGWTNRGWGPSFGVQVIVDNDKFSNGSSGLWCGYMHLSKVAVKLGQRVKKGQLIGYSGNTGATTGPHLHLQVLATRYWNPLKPAHVNPQKWIDA